MHVKIFAYFLFKKIKSAKDFVFYPNHLIDFSNLSLKFCQKNENSNFVLISKKMKREQQSKNSLRTGQQSIEI